MESGDLRVFEAVARLGSITAASDELHTVQSNVTARIRALENELGVVLFRRHSRGVVLTRAGERLLPYAMKIGHLLKDAVNVVGTMLRPGEIFRSARSNRPRAFACRRSYLLTGGSFPT
jgi:LysR family transcriptional regulator, cell division regulator